MLQGGILWVEEGVQVDPAELGPASEETGGPQAFPVFKAVPGSGQTDRHDPVAWWVVQDLQDKVAKYGLGSAQVMQIIRVLNTDLLAPYDIRHLAQVLFQPVQFKLFEENWRQMADSASTENMHRPQPDPRHAGPRETFLKFVEKIAAALEKQVEDDNIRQLLCKQLAKDNANLDCAKIIHALPGDPSLTEMIQACAKVGTIDHEITTAAAMWQHQKTLGGGNKKQGKKND
ncbi:hypothetical protein Nmel_001611 [Mimus melanotis]